MGTELRIYSKDANFWNYSDALRYEDAIRDAIDVISETGNSSQKAIAKLNQLIDRAKKIGDESIEAEYQEHLSREAEYNRQRDEIPF